MNNNWLGSDYGGFDSDEVNRRELAETYDEDE